MLSAVGKIDKLLTFYHLYLLIEEIYQQISNLLLFK